VKGSCLPSDMSTLLVATEVDVPMANGAGSDMVDLGFFGIEVGRF
jgi:hypothetical protein